MHVIVWEFQVVPDRVAEFMQAYGPEGEWAQLLRRAPGFIGTELMVGDNGEFCFLTADRWASAEDYDRFRKRFAAEYEALDRRFRELTASESKVGTFEHN